MSQRHVDTIWCDDVRHEVGGKYSLIGVYHSKLIPSSLPITLPKLCVIVKVASPIDQIPTALTVQVRKNEGEWTETDHEEVLHKVSLPEKDLVAASDDLRASGEMDDKDGELDRRHVVQLIIPMSPLRIERPCLLRVNVQMDTEEARGGALQVTEPPDSSA